jgi:hypothetical protein
MGGDDMDGIQISFFDEEISDEEKRLREILKRGSGFEGGCLRIYAADKLLDDDRFVMFLADEFNVGGHSVTLEGFRGFCDYNGRGMIIREWRTAQEWKYGWKKIAHVYRDMISTGEFPDYKVITMYEEARKAGKCAPAPRMHYFGGDR